MQDKISEIFRKHDPIGIASITKRPSEYDSEAGLLMKKWGEKLSSGKKPTERLLYELVEQTLTEQFTKDLLPDRTNIKQLTADLWANKDELKNE